MENLEFDQRTKEEIIEQIRQKAKSYVPEWRLDLENYDIGTALALVYAQMLLGTVKKVNNLPYKNKISFFNTLEAELLSAVPSKGYITFSLVNEEVTGEEVPAGMEVVAQVKGEENLSFETLEDIFVTPAVPSCILETSIKNDYIGEIYNLHSDKKDIVLFANSAANLQKHFFCFAREEAFYIKESGKIVLDFFLKGEKVPKEYLEILSNPQYAVFEYSSKEGYVPFTKVERKDNQLIFQIERENPSFWKQEEEGIDNYWIRCKVHDITLLQRFCFDDLQIATSCEKVKPDNIYANGYDVNKEEFFPFGEQFSIYDELYFSSEEVFLKKGSVITIAFHLDFVKAAFDYQENNKTEWEWVMKESDFKPDIEYDITIEEVVWEYYNGQGWTTLFENNEYSDIFSIEYGMVGQYKKMVFVCPQDIEPILVNAYESYYIRARVLKVNNLYKMKGNFISPRIGNVSLKYDYQSNPLKPDIFYTENNRECRKYYFTKGRKRETIVPFYGLTEKLDTLYLGFDSAPVGGPIKILFDVMYQKDKGCHKLLWEYYNGTCWKELDLVDETEDFSKTGIVTLIGMKDCVCHNIYQYNKYWFRITDIQGSYMGAEKSYPCLNGIYMNSVKIRQKDREETEYFQMEVYQENVQFTLLCGKIYGCEVYVDEMGCLSKKEMDILKKKHKLYPDYHDNGEIKRAWVKWERVNDFLDSNSDNRHFVLDRNKGIIQFGNGKNGRIPPTKKVENIKVVYKSGGGENTNVPAGTVTQLGKYIGFISKVNNPKMLIGGSESESLTEALCRNAAMLRHQNMAITTRDFEEIAKDASRSIKRVKCFSGIDNKEQKMSGAITLVVLQKEFGRKESNFQDICLEVENYMKDKMNTVLLDKNRFFVTEPKFVELRIRMEVLVESFENVFYVKKQILERLDNFINPLTGNFDGMGWQIGTLPNVFQIQNAISDIEGLRHIKNIYVSAYCMEDAKILEVDLSIIRKSRYILPVSGEHDIITKVVKCR